MQPELLVVPSNRAVTLARDPFAAGATRHLYRKGLGQMRLAVLPLVVGLCLWISGCARGLPDLATSSSGNSGNQTASTSAPTLAFSIQPDKIPQGGSATLTWSSTNATTVTINNGIGNVAPSGSLSIVASASQSFTATATGPGGTTAEHAALTVLGVPTITVAVCPAAEPDCGGRASTLIRKNARAILSWQAQNATPASIAQ